MVGLLFKNLPRHSFTSCQTQRQPCWARSVFVQTSIAQTLAAYSGIYDMSLQRGLERMRARNIEQTTCWVMCKKGQLLRSRYLLFLKPGFTHTTLKDKTIFYLQYSLFDANLWWLQQWQALNTLEAQRNTPNTCEYVQYALYPTILLCHNNVKAKKVLYSMPKISQTTFNGVNKVGQCHSIKPLWAETSSIG